MKVVSNFAHDLHGGIIPNLKLEQFSQDDGENVLFYGYATTVDKGLQEQHKHYKRKVLLNLWEPTQWFGAPLEGKDIFEQVEYFDEIYTICPYTKQWHKEVFGDDRYKYIFHPYDNSVVLNDDDYRKEVDVVYFGGLHGDEHRDMAEIISKFNYNIISKQNARYVTHHDLSHEDKIRQIAKAKISIVFNKCYLQDQHVNWAKQIPHYEKNRALSRLGDYQCPQYKARMAESGYCKAMMFVIDDHWNIAEDHWGDRFGFPLYIPTTMLTLEKDIEYWLEHYNKDHGGIEATYQKALTHNSEHLYNMIKRGEECIHRN